ncbi:MAG: SlyX family protein [Pseudomonadales bacterium]
MTSDNKLIDLETRISFQEDMLQSLNTLCYEQERRLTLLERQNKELIDHVRDLLGEQSGGESAEQQRPPHF